MKAIMAAGILQSGQSIIAFIAYFRIKMAR